MMVFSEIEALQHIQSNNQLLKEKSQEMLLSLHERLIYYYAYQYPHRYLYFDDLVQEGRMALIHAANKFDTSKGVKFITYATYWIRQGMSRYVDQKTKLIRKPQGIVDQLKKEKKQTHHHVLSMDDMEEKNKALMIADTINDPHQSYILNIYESMIQQFFIYITPLQQNILTKKYGLDGFPEMSINQLNKSLKIPKKKIIEEENKAIAILKQYIKESYEYHSS
jgi:RNA polymerase sigma factor (sigma-70 family)